MSKKPTSQPVDGNAADLAAALASEGLPTDDLAEPGRVFFRFVDDDGRVVGFGGYELYCEDELLRSIVVVAEMRGRGHGRVSSPASWAWHGQPAGGAPS